MCMAFEMNCACGSGMAGFNFKDEVMSEEVINGLYCPSCSSRIVFNPDTMIFDNGWIIEYDMDIARFQAQKIGKSIGPITPEFIFDEGYCTWRGMYPSDHIDSVKEREDIVKLAKINPRQYLEEIKDWAKKRMERLSEEGWRKANGKERVCV
ncbi:MAG: hypothetical protein ACK415_04105 [Thermodesulfovibrionales bacterium]